MLARGFLAADGWELWVDQRRACWRPPFMGRCPAPRRQRRAVRALGKCLHERDAVHVRHVRVVPSNERLAPAAPSGALSIGCPRPYGGSGWVGGGGGGVGQLDPIRGRNPSALLSQSRSDDNDPAGPHEEGAKGAGKCIECVCIVWKGNIFFVDICRGIYVSK